MTHFGSAPYNFSMRKTIHSVLWSASLALCACLPVNLKKYKNQDYKLQPTPDIGESGVYPGMDGESESLRSKVPPPRATIYAVDADTFRVNVREGEVWDAALSVLMHNYSPTVIDRASGIFSTEWDSYFLNGGVYRNKVSVRLVRAGPGATDLIIHNNVEHLRDGSQAGGAVGAVWLPTTDPANEIGRIVQNMALVLGQPPPVFQPIAAKSTGAGLESGAVLR